MPRIKGWKKIRAIDPDETIWVNIGKKVDFGFGNIQYVKTKIFLTKFGRNDYEVKILKFIPQEFAEPRLHSVVSEKTFKTKASALKFAHNYMKRHPNG